jgi:phosphoribosyl 1,2-cyclic phosphodiesterase
VAVTPAGEDVPTLVLDGGTGLRVLTRMLDGRPFLGALVMTHLHWDHVIGLPFFAAGDRPEGRVRMLLPAQDSPPEELVRRVMSPPYFPIGPEGLQGRWSFEAYDEGTADLGAFRVTAREIPHGGGRTMGLRVTDGERTVAFVPDHAPHFAGPGDDGLGEFHPAILELCRDVDLLVHDCQYTARELPARWRFGHAAVEYTTRLAELCGVGRLLMFHHEPTRDDDGLDAMLAAARASTAVPVDAAVEGAHLDV